MDAAKLRAVILERRFRPVRITLNAGSPIVVRHPENILISNEWVAVARDSDPPIVFEVEEIVSIEFLHNGGPRHKSG